MPTLKSRYQTMVEEREPYLRRAREAAKLTLPHLMPPEGYDGSQDLYQPFQSIGSRGVTSLASKLLLALFPPTQAFFRMRLDASARIEVEENAPESMTQIEDSLSLIEELGMTEFSTRVYRPKLYEGAEQLIVAGNFLQHLPKTEGAQVFRLDQYVVDRDPEGRLLEIILKQRIDPLFLPEDMQTLSDDEDEGENGKRKTVGLYTGVRRIAKNRFTVWQEAKGHEIPKTRQNYSEDELPWRALRIEPVDGENYGYGYVNGLIGDLKSCEGLAQALVEGGAAASKLLFMVSPNGQTRLEDIANKPNGSIVAGREEDITTLGLGNQAADMRVTQEVYREVIERLSAAFLLNTSVTRQAERVTAEEIRFLAQELEDTFAGGYSLLSSDWQLPLVSLTLSRMKKEGRLPDFDNELIKPEIVTGLEALGRGHDLTKLDVFIQGSVQALGPDLIARYVNVGDYLRRKAVALSIKTDGLIKTDEQIAQEDQQAQLQAAAQTFGPEVVRAISQNQGEQQ